MAQTIRVGDREVSRVAIVDDSILVRDEYRETVTEAELSPIEYANDLPPNPEGAVEAFLKNSDAALCDYMLMGTYASYDGTKLVKACYERGFPAVLCTSYEESADVWRVFLPWIPVRLAETQLDPDSLRLGIETCLKELVVGRTQHREPWRTLVRVELVENDHIFIVVPAWDPHQKVKVLRTSVPRDLDQNIQEEWRGFAHVNLGAESLDELFIMNWEVP